MTNGPAAKALSPASVLVMESDELLTRGGIGRLGLHDDNESYLVPVAYTYITGGDLPAAVGARIIARLSPGRKLDLLRRAPDAACFEVDSIGTDGRCHRVVAWGPIAELSGLDAERALAQLLRTTPSPSDDVLPAAWVDQASRHPKKSASVIAMRVLQTDLLVTPERAW